jgi:hypothetical protein
MGANNYDNLNYQNTEKLMLLLILQQLKKLSSFLVMSWQSYLHYPLLVIGISFLMATTQDKGKKKCYEKLGSHQQQYPKKKK